MAEESDLERIYPATPRRLQQAREHGQVARSRELTAAAMALVALAGLSGLGPQFMRRCMLLVEQGMRFDHATATADDHIARTLSGMSFDVLTAIAPLLVVLLLATLAGPLLLSGWNFSANALLPDFSRLDPARGLSNMLSTRGLAELVKALLKTALIAAVGGYAIWHMWGEMQSLVV
ncbi:MAG TPA: EscU/YscU/HrcU family type III secretion system export apparatus switch protein, partial [Burkholderiales bacterium]|nr:EscU/YscU/HrcU family type III secretion system export apparatus switch protein [Burkholderiales bacterium]